MKKRKSNEKILLKTCVICNTYHHIHHRVSYPLCPSLLNNDIYLLDKVSLPSQSNMIPDNKHR